MIQTLENNFETIQINFMVNHLNFSLISAGACKCVKMRGRDKNHFPKLIKAHTRILRIETFSPIISFSEIRNSLARSQIHDDEQYDSLFIIFGNLTHSEEIFSPKVITHTLLILNSLLDFHIFPIKFLAIIFYFLEIFFTQEYQNFHDKVEILGFA